MKAIALLAVLAFISCGAGCPSTTTDLTGAGFVLESPSAATREFIIKNDRPFAETVAVNRETCLKSPGCVKP